MVACKGIDRILLVLVLGHSRNATKPEHGQALSVGDTPKFSITQDARMKLVRAHCRSYIGARFLSAYCNLDGVLLYTWTLTPLDFSFLSLDEATSAEEYRLKRRPHSHHFKVESSL